MTESATAAGPAPTTSPAAEAGTPETPKVERIGPPAEPARKRGIPGLRLILLVVLPAAALALGTWAYLAGGRYVTTDNAYVGAQKVLITPDVSGRITGVSVAEGQPVKTGDPLFQIDASIYAAAVRQAGAQLAQARSDYLDLKATLEGLDDQIAFSKQVIEARTTQLARNKILAARGIAAKDAVNDWNVTVATAKTQLAALEQQRSQSLARLLGDPKLPLEAYPAYMQAAAVLEKAERDLANTAVKAPIDGIATQVANIQVGRYLTAGTPVFAIIASAAPWVEANPKETDLTYVVTGQPVTITVDTFPSRTWHGRVESISPGTGAQFSILPAQNASGNWVKVVQRVPVRIAFEAGEDTHDLRAGLSVYVSIDTHRNRTLAGLLGLAGTARGVALERHAVSHEATIPTTVVERTLITICVMMATIMQALDTTIANVALPYMQGSLSATLDQVSWVLTSYIVAAAIMTAPTGWLALRFGRKRLLILCSAGFTVASMLCGIAQSIEQMVLFRLLQGVFGAALVPLSQAVMMDVFPPAQRGAAMSIWGMGVMLGPILGPSLGGYLTDASSWRWVFFVNVPFGIATVAGLMLFMRETEPQRERSFDWLGFGMLSLGIGALQLMLDRGEQAGWFTSPEIVAYAVLTGVGTYYFLAHSLTAERPFIPLAMFADRNFSVSVVFMFLVGILILATLALVTPYVQNVMGYPIIAAGHILGTRGIGTMVSMMVVGRLSNRVDPRLMVGLGLGLSTLSLYQLTFLSPDTSASSLIWTSVIQGVGLGLVFVPLNTIAFATLAPALRTEAAAIWTLIRNLGSSIGVSVVIAMLSNGTSLMHARLGESLTPFNTGLQMQMGGPLDPSTDQGVTLLEQMLTREAGLIAFANDFWLMTLVSLAAFPLLLLLRRTPVLLGPPPAPVAD